MRPSSTISRIVSSIKVYYDYLCSEGIRNDNPTKAIKLRDSRSRDIQLQDLKRLVAQTGIQLQFSEYVLEFLSENGYDPQFGARPLKRLIQKDDKVAE